MFKKKLLSTPRSRNGSSSKGDGDEMRIGMEDLDDKDDPDYNEQNLEGDADVEVQGSSLDDILGMLRAMDIFHVSLL
ncbi:hypothetical protein Q3G72_003395 [Acer saccharum]|nr:hypothetical protein Q3G72_003395 [Acer saccharum]